MTLEVDVSVRRGAFELRVAAQARPGETVAIVGPQGAGKTTLLLAMAGLLPLHQGRVVLDGAVLEDTATRTRIPPERRSIGMAFQDHLLFPHLTALENVAYGLRRRGEGWAEARRRAGQWLDSVGLADRSRTRPRELSGDEAQRVALARALATEPRVLLLDEPLSALEASARPEARRLLVDHLRRFGGVRVVTHDPLEAMAGADRLVVIEAGRVVQEGTPQALRARPSSRYVADVVGVNLLRGVGRVDHIELPGGQLLVAPDAGEGDVLAVVHPRAVGVHRLPPVGAPGNVLRGEAAAVDHEGDRIRVRITGAVPLVAELTPAAVAELQLADGGPVWLSVKATEIAVYPT